MMGIYSILCFLLPVLLVNALNGIVVPTEIIAGEPIQIRFENGESNVTDEYKVFLAASSNDNLGPYCYLKNLSSLISGFDIRIPSAVIPNGTYAIAIADITTSQGATFSNMFNLTGGNATPTAYEQSLDGAPFWNAYDLPCSAMGCARDCASIGFPADLTDESAYKTMSSCIEKCPGVSPDTNTTQPARSGQAISVPIAVVTVAPSVVLTAYETTVTSNGSSLLAAVVDGQTLTIDNSAKTVVSTDLSLATSGLVVGNTTTVPFTITSATATPTSSSGPHNSADRKGLDTTLFTALSLACFFLVLC